MAPTLPNTCASRGAMIYDPESRRITGLNGSVEQRITWRCPLDRCPPTHGDCGSATNRFLSDYASQTRREYRRTPDSGQNGGERLKVSNKASPTARLPTKD